MIDRLKNLQTSGVRWRTTLAAVAVTAVALVIGALLLLWLLTSRLQADLDNTLETQARDRVQLIDAGAHPSAIADTRQSESVVWFGTDVGDPIVAAGSYQIVGTPSDLSVGSARAMTVLADENYGDKSEQEHIDIRAAIAQAADGTLVLVGAETEIVTETTGEVARLLAAGLPLLLLAVGGVTWRATARTLRPVEEIRATAEAIGAGKLSARVPEPESRDEVQHLAVTMNGMLDRIEAQQRAQRRFTADASHELKSPVANLRAVVDTTTLDDPGWPDVQQRLASESERLTSIVDNLLFLSVDDEGAPAAQRDVVHLDDILFDEAELLAARSTIRPDISGVEPCEVVGNAEQLRRVVRNLVQNAERHADEWIGLSCASGDRVELSVADDGPGVPAEQRDTIFERFGRSDQARDRQSGGAGLGLAIVRTIVDGHDGVVEVDDSARGGAKFTVSFPQSSSNQPRS